MAKMIVTDALIRLMHKEGLYVCYAEKGKQLYMTIGCQACHGRTAQGVGGNRKLAPKPISLAAAITYIRKPAGQMIAYGPKILSDAEIADMWAYLQTIPDNPAPASVAILKNW